MNPSLILVSKSIILLFYLATTAHSQGQDDGDYTSSACLINIPDERCGIVNWPKRSCKDIINGYVWEGSCCSFSDTNNGQGCKLTVNGKDSYCKWRELDQQSYYNIFIGEGSDDCPMSSYKLEGVKSASKFTECLAKSFNACTAHCAAYSEFKRTFRTCMSTRPTETIFCTEEAVTDCADTQGDAPEYMCHRLLDLLVKGYVDQETCLELQKRCGSIVPETACSKNKSSQHSNE